MRALIGKIMLLQACLVCWTASAEVMQITLEQAVTKGVAASDEIKIKLNEQNKTTQQYIEAKGAIYPHVNAEVGVANYLKAPPPIILPLPGSPIEIPTKQKYELSTSVTATQILWAFGKVSTAIELAEKAMSMSEINVKAASNELRNSIKNAYYTVLMAKHSMENAKKSYQNVLHNKSILDEKFKLGRAPKGDNIKMASDISARIPTLKEATANYELAKNYLKMLLDIDEKTEIELTDGFSTQLKSYDQDKLLADLKANHPTLKMLQKNVGLNQDLVTIRKADFYPTLAAYGSYVYSGQNQEFSFDSDNMNAVGVVGVKLSIPIFNGGEKTGKLQQALIDKNSSELQLSKVTKGLELQLKNSLASYNAAIETYKANLETIRLTRQTYAMTQDRFMAGTATLTELNDMERALSGTELMASATLYKLNQLQATIEMLIASEEK